MTPYDLYKKFLTDLTFTPPEEGLEVKLARVATVIKKLERIYEHGRRTEAADEVIAVLVKLREYEAMVRSL